MAVMVEIDAAGIDWLIKQPRTLDERGAEKGFSLPQLRRARNTIGAIAYKRRGENLSSPWMWCLPEYKPADVESEDESA